MYYKIHQKQGVRIHSMVAFAGVLLIVGTLSAFFSHRKPATPPHTSTEKLARTELANIRDNTVTVYWQTAKPSTGYIKYGSSSQNLTQKAIDKHDTETLFSLRRNHIVTINNLTSSTDYYYRVVVNDVPVGQTQDIPFQFKTTRYVKNPLNMDPVIGKVVDENGKISADSVILLYIGSAYPLATQTKLDGSFILSPCCIFDSASYEPIFPQKNDRIIVEIIDEQGKSKKITSTLSNIDSVTSTISLGSQVEEGTALGVFDDKTVLQMAEDIANPEVIDIVFPKEGVLIPGTMPLIKGVGIPGKAVKVTMEPGNKIFETTIAFNKVWQFQPSYDFPAGENRLAVTTQDENGKTVALHRTFFIEKSGESVLGDATPSATLTPLATPTFEMLPSPTEVLSTVMPSLPKSGINILPFGFASGLLILVGAGMILLL